MRGSSPRVRGTPPNKKTVICRGRFIPACAGNTVDHPHPSTWGAVHPRVCGEHTTNLSPEQQAIGSSPRVRGTLDDMGLFACKSRFIPACAGNTGTMQASGKQSSVHPRVCGEHDDGAETVNSKNGSSPRVRGTHIMADARRLAERFIPACAGNTCECRRYRVKNAVHPRVCGEHPHTNRSRHKHFGSSPRVRGTPLRQPCDLQ